MNTKLWLQWHWHWHLRVQLNSLEPNEHQALATMALASAIMNRYSCPAAVMAIEVLAPSNKLYKVATVPARLNEH